MASQRTCHRCKATVFWVTLYRGASAWTVCDRNRVLVADKHGKMTERWGYALHVCKQPSERAAFARRLRDLANLIETGQ